MSTANSVTYETDTTKSNDVTFDLHVQLDRRGVKVASAVVAVAGFLLARRAYKAVKFQNRVVSANA